MFLQSSSRVSVYYPGAPCHDNVMRRFTCLITYTAGTDPVLSYEEMPSETPAVAFKSFRRLHREKV
jgi:hypothetical protein